MTLTLRGEGGEGREGEGGKEWRGREGIEKKNNNVIIKGYDKSAVSSLYIMPHINEAPSVRQTFVFIESEICRQRAWF